MGKRQVIATRLVAAFGVLLSFTSLHAQPPGPPPGGPDPASLPTPRLPNGKPDLTGSWQPSGGGQRGVAGGMFRRCSPFQSNCMEWTSQSSDFVFMAPSRLDPQPSAVQARVLGQGPAARHVDEPRRSGHDVFTARNSAAGRAGANLCDRLRHHDDLPRRARRRRRIHRAPDGADGRPQARSAARAPVHVHRIHGWELGRRHARARLGRFHRRDLARLRPAVFIPIRCTSWRSSRAKGTRCSTRSRSMIRKCS